MQGFLEITEMLKQPFIQRAFIATIGIAIITSIMGCFMIWRRLAYFGDSISNSALLGGTIGIIFSFNISLIILLFCVAFSLIIFWLQANVKLPTDSLLGILSHSLLAIGIITISMLKTIEIDPFNFLFGEVVAITKNDISMIYFGGGLILFLMRIYYEPLLISTINRDLAKAEGVKQAFIDVFFTLSLAIIISISVRIIGVLLIISLLIIPGATARLYAKSPINMIIFSCVISIIAANIGIMLSIFYDVPTGPTIVAVLAGFFFTSAIFIKKN